jgi:Rod binding domain-containing protein
MSLDGVLQPTGAMLPVPRGLDDGGLASIRRMAPTEGRRAAAQEVQAALFAQLLAAMRRTLPTGSLFPDVPGRDVYESMFDRELAQALMHADPLGLVATLAGESAATPADAGADHTPARTASAAVAPLPPATIGSRDDAPRGVGGAQEAAPAGLTADAVTGAAAWRRAQEAAGSYR